MTERLKVIQARARQRALGRGLRAHFESFANEQIPEEFLKALNEWDARHPVRRAVRIAAAATGVKAKGKKS